MKAMLSMLAVVAVALLIGCDKNDIPFIPYEDSVSNITITDSTVTYVGGQDNTGESNVDARNEAATK